MNNIIIKIKNIDKYYLFSVLIKNNICYSYEYEKEGYKYLKISVSDYKKIKKIFKKSKIVKYYGINFISNFIKENYIFLFSFVWGIIIILMLSNTIFDIKVNTLDKKLKEIIINELEINNIKKYGKIKSYDELNRIKKEIINNNPNLIEWLEIKRNGTTYIIEVTPRIIVEAKNKDTTPRHIVASKDARIMHIISDAGTIVKEKDDYVKKGEIIISGNIIKGEDTIKAQVRASGIIYGEVWYTAKISVPYTYTEYVKTGKVIKHYYAQNSLGKMTILGRYNTDNSMSEKKTIIDKPYLPFKIIKETKTIYEYKKYKVTKEKAIEEAIRRADKSISVKLNENEYVTSKKVLNISPYSSKIEVEIFYKVYENITDTLLIEGSEISEEGIN